MKESKQLLKIEKKALIYSTATLPGDKQMALDLHFLDQTISKPDIFLTLIITDSSDMTLRKILTMNIEKIEIMTNFIFVKKLLGKCILFIMQ